MCPFIYLVSSLRLVSSDGSQGRRVADGRKGNVSCRVLLVSPVVPSAETVEKSESVTGLELGTTSITLSTTRENH